MERERAGGLGGLEHVEHAAGIVIDGEAQRRASTERPIGGEDGLEPVFGLDVAHVPPRYRSTYFRHIFGDSTGYSAGY